MGKVIAVCTSEKKGTQKTQKASVKIVVEHGIEGDAHAGKWHRQISLLAYEKIEAFKAKGVHVDVGAFGENIIVEGIDLSSLPVGTQLEAGDILFEVTQIGKECHNHCAIYAAVGDCIMPREGIFVRVLQGGQLQEGDEINLVEA